MDNRKAFRMILGYALILFQSLTFAAKNSDDLSKKETERNIDQAASTIKQFTEVEKLIRREPVKRGSIYSRDGVLLAESRLVTEIAMLPQRVYCPSIANTKLCFSKLLKDIQSILSLSKKEFRRAQVILNGGKFRIVLIRSSKIKENLMRLKAIAKEHEGVYITSRYQRHYQHPKYYSHVVGYVKSKQIIKSENKEFNFYLSRLARKQIGQAGLEKYYDQSLAGENNQSNKQDSDTPFIGVPSKPKNLHISINLKMQKRTYQLLKKRQGSVVAFDPNNGEVLSLLSFPGFNANYQAAKDDPRIRRKPRRFKRSSMYPRFKAGRYPPGSTIKPIYALAGLHHGLVNQRKKLRCTGVYKPGGMSRPFHDWEVHGHVRFSSAIAKSCNVYFYGLSQKLKIDRITGILKKFNIGLPSGIDLPNERTGIRPSREYKRKLYIKKYPKRMKKNPAIARWYRGDSLAVGIGQGYLAVTPLQLATMVSMIAARGKFNIPRLLLSTENIDSKKREYTKAIQQDREPVIKAKHWESVVAAMTGVVHRYKVGTAFKSARYITGRYKVAGKTGTAQVVSLAQEKLAKENGEKLPWEQRDHSLFIGFAPAKKPQIAVAVIIDHGGHGSDAAAPAAIKLINYYLMAVSKNKPERKYKRKTKKKSKKPGKPKKSKKVNKPKKINKTNKPKNTEKITKPKGVEKTINPNKPNNTGEAIKTNQPGG